MKSLRVLAGMLLALCLAGPAAAGAEGIVISGSTTVLPIMQKAVEAYLKLHPDLEISLTASGSGDGIKAIMDGTANLAMSSREMKDSELEKAKDKNVNLNPMAIATDAILPIVNPANTVPGVTKAQLKAIYTGEITNWKELGGADAPIVVVSRDSSSGTYEAWGELVLDKARVTPKALLQASSGAVLQFVSQNKNAIGYDSFGYVNSSVKGLPVDGVAGDPETIDSGKYPITRKLWVIAGENPGADVAAFLDFLIKTKEVRNIISSCGAVPVKQ